MRTGSDALSRLVPFAAAALAAACAPTGGLGGGPPGGMGPSARTPIDVPQVPQLNGAHAAVKQGLAVYMSGQVAFDSTGAVVGEGDLQVQLGQAMRNLERVVRAARGLPADVVKITVYAVGSAADATAALREVMNEVFPVSPQPAVTVVQIAGLSRPDLLVAVDGIALLRSEFPDRERDPRR